MNIQDSHLVLTVVDSGAKADVLINPVGNIICHLTQGFNSSTYPLGQGNAITAGAHLPVVPGPGESVSAWNFGFVQIGRIINPAFTGIFYAGRIRREGSITVNPSVPPGLASPILYDATGSPPDPWFETPNPSFTPPNINAGWGDHPSLKVPLKLRNSGRSNVDNFLFQLILDREFWTIFTATDPPGKIHYIAHFHWQVRYDLELMWRNGNAALRRNKSFHKVLEAKVMGAPTDPALRTLLANPSGDRANKLFGHSITQSFLGPRGPNRTENDNWFATVPYDFWG
ncbi:MAG: hypothetical protein WCE61_05820 [Candidatus Acidiferrum sp.]